MQYAAGYVDDRPMPFAYEERVKSVKDLPGRFGYAAVKHGIACIVRLGGVPYYVPVAAVADVVATIAREGVHFIFHSQEPFCEGHSIESVYRTHHRS